MNPQDLQVVLGRLAVEKGFVTEAQLREAMAELSGARALRPVGEILIEKGWVTPAQLELLRREPAPAAPARLGKYSLVRQLGAGGMGTVYEAVDTVLHRTVALKTLSPVPGQDAREAALDQERFLREARLAGGLPKHPNVVSVHEAGRADGRPYLVMEYVQGVHFGQWRAARRDDLRAQVALLRDVARAVHHAHEHGILHRDLKPQNVLVDAKDVAHVTDFGLAKPLTKELTESLTTSGMVVGTPSYMSPEQAMGLKTPDRRSDVYALGVLLFEILTERTPFVADTAVEMLVKVIDQPAPSPSEVCRARGAAAPDPALEAICVRAIAKRPEERPPSAAAFADALEGWLGRPSKRPRRVAGVATAAALLLLLAVAAFFFRPAKDVRPLLEGHAGAVNAVAFLPDGRLLTGSADRTLRLWDPAGEGAPQVFGPLQAKVEAVAAAPDGRWVAAVTEPEEGGGEVALWPSEGGAPRLLEGHGEGVNALALSRDGRRLATGDQEGTLKLWDPGSGRELASWRAHAQAVRGAAFSPDGRHLATGGWDRLLLLWDVETRKQLAVFEGHEEGVWGVAYSPDGRLIASAGSDGALRLWDVETRRPRTQLRGHREVVVGVAFSPDGRRLASGGWDRTARIWDVESGRELRVLTGHQDSVWCVAFSPDSRFLATGSLDRTVRLWSVNDPIGFER